MSRYLIVFGLAALWLAGCGAQSVTPTAPRRTPLPTWTLPFVPPTATSVPATLTAMPTNTLVLRTFPPPTPEVTPTPSPTARPGIDPTLGASSPDPFATHELPIPEPMPQLRFDKDTINILLLGRDTARESRSYRTDVIIVASVNKKDNAVTLLTIPRDLFVYIPGWTMNRINTAAGRGDAIRYPGGGVALLEQTILYNLGIPIHGWARVDFGGFQDVVDILGGVDIPVSCEMTDWRLKDPGLNDQDPNNWELYTVGTGLQHMDGDLALWYARSRKHSSDFDRARRQHQVLRAIFDKALQLGALTKVPELYAQYIQIVDTDLGLGDLLQFVPLAVQLDRSRIKSRFIGRDHVYGWTTSAGAAVLLPDRDAISRLLGEAFLPPAENVLARDAPAVEIWNSTAHADWAALAADNLAWAGIRPVIGQAEASSQLTTILYDYSASPKGSVRRELQRIFHVRDDHVIAAADPSAAYAFRVVLGDDYDSCVQPVRTARATPTPGAAFPPVDTAVHAAAVLDPPPGINGDLAEWTFLVYPIDAANFGPQNWRGPDDLSAVWNIAWDVNFLYIALQIKDDVFVQAARGENLFRGDSLEIWLDTDPGRRTRLLTERDFQLGISPGALGSPAATAEAYLWLPTAEARPVSGVVVGSRLVSGGYNLEVAVPWSIFRVAPSAGQSFGFTLSLNDDDSPGSPDQETQASNVKEASRTDPTTWGVLVLDPPPAP